MDSSIHLTLDQRIQSIRDKWFLIDPGFFMVLCTHVIELSRGIGCGIACGGGHIYVNPDFFEYKSDAFLESALKLEIIRIILKHPYQRQLPDRVKMYLASNMTIASNCKFDGMNLMTPSSFFGSHEFDRENMELIYDNISFSEPSSTKEGAGSSSSKKKQGKSQSHEVGDKSSTGRKSIDGFDDSCSSAEDAFNRSQFWKEDELKIVEMNNIIEKINKTNSWGTMAGDIVNVIEKSIESKFNYKALFQQFRSTILSSSRVLTRMKPNRRFGYLAAGSKRNFTTKILVAVDTSSSISDEELELALDFINKFFKYGVAQIDTIQFDTEINENSLQKLSKKIHRYTIHGRGGTDFNCIFKYVQEDGHLYDGVIIVTDGYADVPYKKWLSTNFKNTRYLWCINNEIRWHHFFTEAKEFQQFGKCTFVDKR